jgi:hypothetical protein
MRDDAGWRLFVQVVFLNCLALLLIVYSTFSFIFVYLLVSFINTRVRYCATTFLMLPSRPAPHRACQPSFPIPASRGLLLPRHSKSDFLTSRASAQPVVDVDCPLKRDV